MADELRAHIDAGYTTHLDGKELVFSAGPLGGDLRRAPRWANGRDPLKVIAEAEAQGKSLADVAAEAGVSRQTVGMSVRRRRRLESARVDRPPFPGRPLDDSAFWNITNRAAKRIGMEHFRVHDLRGSCASNMVDAGIPATVVAAQLGDTVDMVVKRYLRTTEEATLMAMMAWDAATRRELRPVLRPVAELPG